MVSAGLAIALLWGWSFVIAAQNDPVGTDPTHTCRKSRPPAHLGPGPPHDQRDVPMPGYVLPVTRAGP